MNHLLENDPYTSPETKEVKIIVRKILCQSRDINNMYRDNEQEI